MYRRNTETILRNDVVQAAGELTDALLALYQCKDVYYRDTSKQNYAAIAPADERARSCQSNLVDSVLRLRDYTCIPSDIKRSE